MKEDIWLITIAWIPNLRDQQGIEIIGYIGQVSMPIQDIKIEKYHGLPPLHHCFQSAQPYTEDGLVSSNESDEVDIDSMTIAEYELYIVKQGLRKNTLNDHSYSFTSNFCDQLPYIRNPQPDDRELSLVEVFSNLFRMGAEKLKGMKQKDAKVEDSDEGNIDDIWEQRSG
nr:hypothetical protein [Tanacetum cinerariifolium]GEZ85892.1 hypothetical protein [Tanacetum cinerariifolium]